MRTSTARILGPDFEAVLIGCGVYLARCRKFPQAFAELFFAQLGTQHQVPQVLHQGLLDKSVTNLGVTFFFSKIAEIAQKIWHREPQSSETNYSNNNGNHELPVCYAFHRQLLRRLAPTIRRKIDGVKRLLFCDLRVANPALRKVYVCGSRRPIPILIPSGVTP